MVWPTFGSRTAREQSRTPTRSSVLQLEVLVRKLFSVDALAAGAIVVDWTHDLELQNASRSVDGRDQQTDRQTDRLASHQDIHAGYGEPVGCCSRTFYSQHFHHFVFNRVCSLINWFI